MYYQVWTDQTQTTHTHKPTLTHTDTGHGPLEGLLLGRRGEKKEKKGKGDGWWEGKGRERKERAV